MVIVYLVHLHANLASLQLFVPNALLGTIQMEEHVLSAQNMDVHHVIYLIIVLIAYSLCS